MLIPKGEIGHPSFARPVTEANQGGMPAMKQFVAGPEWGLYSFPISDFQTDGSDITGLAFVSAGTPGKFDFEIDEVEIK
jgi:hypothetical protein